MEPEKHKEFKTPDMYLAAYLVLIGQEAQVNRSESGRVMFHFADFDAADKAVNAYYKRDKVSALDYCAELRNIKARIFTKRRQ
jgi:hypothetical protein